MDGLARVHDQICDRRSNGNRDIMPNQMKAAQITKRGGDFELVERNIPEPCAGQVRVVLTFD